MRRLVIAMVALFASLFAACQEQLVQPEESLEWEGRYLNPASGEVAEATIVILPTLGEAAAAFAINESEQVVGTSVGDDGPHAVLWENGEAIDLGTWDGLEWSRAFDINETGQIVGVSENKPLANRPRIRHALKWENGMMNDLGILENLQFAEAFAINDNGQTVGYSDLDEGGSRPVLWEDGTITNLGTLGGVARALGINDNGQIVGRSTVAGTSSPFHAVLWENGTLVDLGNLGGGWAVANDINNLGQIVGTSVGNDNTRHAFVWSDGIMIDLGIGEAFDINDAGQVVGISDQGPTVWENGRKLILPDLEKSHVRARGINESGNIVVGRISNTAVMWYLGPESPFDTPEEAFDSLLRTMEFFDLGTREARPLSATLQVIERAMADGNDEVAVKLLDSFVKQVESMVRSGRLSETEGETLVDLAQSVIDLMD